METKRKGGTALKLVIGAAAAILLAVIAFHLSDTGPLNVLQTDDGCWEPAGPENKTFQSEQDLRDYASQIGVEVPDSVSFKIINGTLYRETNCVGEISSG